ncbi:MAG: hypothetical protein HW390_3235 [Candidatus Brocadiaceae bacterium]|nr:hypothetical protein [Candidatus Brocadiaceae bacterium]
MARYEHLPIFREAYDLSVHIEKIVRNFSRYHKYTLGTDLRNKSRRILEKIVDANNSRKRRGILTDYTRLYRRAVEQLLVEYYLLEQYDERVEREPERWQREQRQ